MMALRLAALVAALITMTLNAMYGFKTSPVLHYALLFAALNAALDVAKCACLVAASKAWQAGQHLIAVLLFLLFWPLLANSLWCGLSEVSINRATEANTYVTAQAQQTRANAAYTRAAADVALLTTNRLYAATSACALPKTSRELTFCAQHTKATQRLQEQEAALGQPQHTDPAPQVTLLATWSGLDLSLLLLLTALWPIVLAELCGSVGFYLTRSDRTEGPLKAFQWGRRPSPSTATQNATKTPPDVPLPVQAPTIQWSV